MHNMKGAPNFRNSGCTSGKQSFLPPRCPFPIAPPTYGEYGSSHSMGSKGLPKPREGQRHHQRTSSESFLIEEQPSWLDDLLNEPETPVRRGAHRRSSSDSFAYLDASNIYPGVESLAQNDGYKHGTRMGQPSWGLEDFNQQKDERHLSFFPEANSFGRPQNKGWEPVLKAVAYPSSLPLPKDKVVHQRPSSVVKEGQSSGVKEPDAFTSSVTDKQDQEEPSKDPKDSVEKRENSHVKHPQPEMEQKRVKQQFAQRSRVRKLQYIAELERHVQALQAERSEISAELEFLDRQNLILNLENKALKQRLDTVQQEHLIKCFQQEMLDREIARLRALYHQQQQQQQHQQQHPPPTHSRSKSRGLDSQFANLSLKHNEANSGRDPVTGPLHI